ncbi:trigger factor [Candidatus Thiosymbion oneisti]|uniref:trigger factor n=1 Tax=Candidatus Thiosymbion oneisti TaxID=589554 RepID=UPI000A435944|nr:trigger factor [Candidatus Thiosymbion oneisti]
MQVAVENGQGLERRMTVGLEADQVDAEVEKRLREFAHSARVPGFRPGKVPLKVLRQRYGGQMRQEVFGELMRTSFSEAVAKEELRPVGVPRIEPDMDVSARRYAYRAVFEVLPRFELGRLDGKTLKRPVAEVADADLEAMLMRLREQQRTWSVVERPAQLSDRLKISYTGTLDGEPFEGGSAEDIEVELGLGDMLPGFEEGLVGVQAGDERRLDLTFPDFPDQHPSEHLSGKPVVFTVRVGEVAEPVLPELNADFARGLGFPDGDLDGFRLELRQNMERELKELIQARVKEQVMDLLLEVNRIDLPEALVREEIGALKQQIRRNLRGSNFELPDDLFRDRASRRVALGLIVGELIKANGIEVDPKRVREMVEGLASTYENPQQAIDYFYADQERLAPVESLTLENQVVDWVLDQIRVEDEPTTFEKLSTAAAVE